MKFNSLKGKTLTAVERPYEDSVVFHSDNGFVYESAHYVDCCESVRVEKVIGDIENIIGSPILEAEETTDCEKDPPEYAESWTRTFQRLKTEKGEVTFVWLGESNGYYGETPHFGLTHAGIYTDE